MFLLFLLSLTYFQDEKNQILTTNIWLNLVSNGTRLEKNTRGFNRVVIYSQGTLIQQLEMYFILLDMGNNSDFKVLSFKTIVRLLLATFLNILFNKGFLQ